ncbi:MAG: BREX system serine/threonine kinase PglW, partial [Planctomycetaceae bacterium]|nr:BREX system serine/threonine kinase PglW [Planctomycetaceae bacterium]
MMKTHWSTITPSQYPWERAALDFVRAGLPDHEPYRAWANFEFQSPDGAIYEVDLLVLTKQGFWIVEIKSRPGRVEGDAGTWTWTDKEGKRLSIDNPVLLANRKAKALSSVLKPRMATQKVPTPWLEALVFLSDPGIQCDLQGAARNRVCLVDREAAEDRPARKGILAALISREAPGVEPMARNAIDIKTAKALVRALEQAGIRPSQKARRVGDYVLGPLLADSPGLCQDRLAEHAALPGVFCRIRQYLVAQAASEDDRQRMKRAAAREFRILQGFDHPGILDARDYKDHEFGPALLFAYEPGAMRLDHFLATRGQALTPTARLEMMRQLADAIRYAHSKKVVHRALGPQSVLIMDPDAEVPRLKVFNWQLGVREAESATTATVHVQDLIDRPALVYMAPEALLDPKAVTEAADVFSLGALAFHLFSGRPPAASPAEMGRTLRENRGLKISAVLDGAGHELEELVRWSTDPDVEMRVQTATDFLEYLDHVEDELTAPAEHHVADPAEARRGDYLEGGYVVERVLGRGATGVALLARQGGAEEFVLKVARDPEANDRLRQEAEALKKVRSEFVVGLHDVREMGGRTVLVLDKAGDETLAERLRKDGPCGLDLLRRFGEDLLQAVASLERHGVAHRDIKPDNIGVRSGKQQLQLVLFDFSLSRVPADQIQVGTRPYLDPFLPLRKPPRWDQEAERYAAGVTLYEMATGVLPRWGDGRSDPALTDAALALEPERIDPAAREGLAGFFAAALARDPARRFHNAEEMLRAWRAVFDEAERRTVTTPDGVEVAVTVDLEAAQLDTPVALLGLSPGAADALDRLDVATVRQLIALPVNEVRFRTGVGGATRQEILRVRHQLRQRYPGAKPAGRTPEPALSDGNADPAGLDLDALRRRVLGGESS